MCVCVCENTFNHTLRKSTQSDHDLCKCLTSVLLMSTHNICFRGEIRIIYVPTLAYLEILISLLSGAMINPCLAE